ncbi:unnamed protein product [Acanthoscelides obtectus]|uniref:Uncharacterized protein n=1 Tax=Acanthoscelides obtectus TaxID=200917 RepID=A0A9P0K6S5_ACAOB|nr:unnamed protein product [Acanthoscelides obtectus]CAK1647241.1 hypothetical protein AOBTE_LOCUS15126 [Acanthoscelides obtectus]
MNECQSQNHVDSMEVVNVLDRESVSVRHLAKRFNIGKTQAAEIAKNKEDIRSKWQSGTNINQKKNFLKKEAWQYCIYQMSVVSQRQVT